jgi:hypothetical protein
MVYGVAYCVLRGASPLRGPVDFVRGCAECLQRGARARQWRCGRPLRFLTDVVAHLHDSHNAFAEA